MAIGAITNVALAIKKEPVNKIEVVWLGGHSFLSKDNKEFNFKQDMQAVRIIFDSNCNKYLNKLKYVITLAQIYFVVKTRKQEISEKEYRS